VSADRLDAMPFTIDCLLTYYIPWGFTSRAKLQYYEDTCLYLILETQHPVLEFLLTPEEYDERDNVCQYNVHQVHLVEAIEDRGDHLDMSPKENEEY